MSGNSFLVLCYKCLTDITDTNNGFVVSCGDFVCGKCIAENSNKTDCPACGKSNVRFADLRSSLPEEIRLKTSDPSKHLESAHTSLIFQVKYYKKIIKKLIEKNERLQLCCNEINSLKSSNQKDSHRNSNFFDYGADEPTLPIQNLIKQRPMSSIEQEMEFPWNSKKGPESRPTSSASERNYDMPSNSIGRTRTPEAFSSRSQRPIGPNAAIAARRLSSPSAAKPRTPTTPSMNINSNQNSPQQPENKYYRDESPTNGNNLGKRPYTNPGPSNRLRSPHTPILRSNFGDAKTSAPNGLNRNFSSANIPGSLKSFPFTKSANISQN